MKVVSMITHRTRKQRQPMPPITIKAAAETTNLTPYKTNLQGDLTVAVEEGEDDRRVNDESGAFIGAYYRKSKLY